MSPLGSKLVSKVAPGDTLVVLGRSKLVYAVSEHPEEADVLVITFQGGGHIIRDATGIVLCITP